MKINGILIFILVILLNPEVKPQGTSLKMLLPDPSFMPGWYFLKQQECYKGDELVELIDGNSELYFEYHFQKVISTQFAETNGSRMHLEIYEMDSDSSAYGLFSSIFQTTDVTNGIGLYSVINDQYVAFIKDKYYVNITWVLRKQALQASMVKLAEAVSDKITVRGKVPKLVSRMNDIKRSGLIIYFRGNVALSAVYYIDFKDHG